MKTLVEIESCKVIDTRELGRAMLKAAEQSGDLKLRSGVQMTGWIADRSGKVRPLSLLCLTDQILGIDTDQGEIYADEVIVASGVGSKFMVKPLGLVLPLMGGKGYSLNIRQKEGGPELPPLTRTFADLGYSLYHNRTKDELRQSGMFEFAPFDDFKVDPR